MSAVPDRVPEREGRGKAAVVTLGCRLNQADAALIHGRLKRAGFEIVPADSPDADVVVVNTCSVTATAARKSRAAAKRAKERCPGAKVIACGCDCERDPLFWNSNGTNAALPNIGKKSVAEIALGEPVSENAFLPSGKLPPTVFREEANAVFPFRHRAFVKIQEGCDSFCTYCVVPLLRGRERSRARDEVMEETRRLVGEGHREIVLTGVNVSAYADNGADLADLVLEILGIPGDFRLRLSSMEPHEANYRLLDVMASERKLCRFLHIPLQHGTDEILERMGRGRSTAEFAEFAETAAAKVPGIHLGTDVIVGFPGETETLFEKSLEFVSHLPLANIHVFRFSPREGTPAAGFDDKVPQRIAKERAGRFDALSKRFSENFERSLAGEKTSLLVEKKLPGGLVEGWSDNYLRLRIASNAAPGEIVEFILGKKISTPSS